MTWHRSTHDRPVGALLAPLVAACLLFTGCAKVTELATGQCQGDSTAILIDNSPTAAADPGFRADQSATAIDAALAACDELYLASFSSVPQEIDLKGAPTKVEGKNSTVRNENRPAATATIVEHVAEHLASAASDPAGSDLVAAVDFAHRTYFGDSEEGARLVIISDGLATRPDLSDPQVTADPEGAVAAIARAGLDSVDLSGVEVVLVGIGHSDDTAPLPRELVDALLQVWEQAFARAGADVEVLEALPNSAGKAAAVRAAASETHDGSEEGASAPIPAAPESSVYVRGGLQATSRRRIRRPGRATQGDGPTPFTPAAPDRTTATALHVAADPTTGSASTTPDEIHAIGEMSTSQRRTIGGRLARRCRRLVGRVAALRASATIQWGDIAQAVRDCARQEQELWGTQLVVAGRTHRTLSRRAAVAIEGAVVCFDAWALGSAVAIAANLPVLDGVFVALGGTAGMVIGAKVLGVAIAHDLEERRFDATGPRNPSTKDLDPAVSYFSTELFRRLSRPYVLGLLGLLAMLVAAAGTVGLVRAESGGTDVAALMFGLTLFTTIATTFVEVLSANVLADQLDQATKQLRRAQRVARRATSKGSSRDLRRVYRLVAQLTAHGEQAVARSDAHDAISRASMHLRQAAHGLTQASTGAPASTPSSLPNEHTLTAQPGVDPFVGVDLGVGHNLAYLRPLAEHLDRELLVEYERAARQHWKVIAARLKKSGIEVPPVERSDRLGADLRDSVPVVSANGSSPKSTSR